MIERIREKEELDEVLEILGELQSQELTDVDEDIVNLLDNKADELELRKRYLECQ